MSFNLNDDNYEAGNIKIFNNGVAGVVEDVTLSVERKKEDDKDEAPLYKLIFTDSSGAIINKGLWYANKATDYKTIDKVQQDQGKLIRNLLKAAYGQDYVIPTFNSAEDMLDSGMKLLREGLKSNPKFRIIVNYGSVKSVKKFLEVRSWAPFIESMNVEKSELFLGDFDAKEGLKEDTLQVNNQSSSTPSPNDSKLNDDDWGD